jgi:hypothetical protein
MNSRDIFHLNFKIGGQILDLPEEDEVSFPPVLVERGFSIGELLNNDLSGDLYMTSWNRLPDRKLVVKRIKDLVQRYDKCNQLSPFQRYSTSWAKPKMFYSL